MNVPKSVNIAVMLVRCSLALGAINAAITSVALVRGRSDAIPIAVTLATVAVGTAFAIFWLSQKVRSRVNWARVALIAIATITLFTVARDVPASFQNSVAQGLVTAACYALSYIAAIILLLPDVHRWFTKGEDGASRVA